MARQRPQKCPQCGRVKAVQQIGFQFYRCGGCGAMFDANPNEGGDYSDRDPSARLTRKEARPGGRN